MNIGQEILSPVENYPFRKFTLIKKIKDNLFTANVSSWITETVSIKFTSSNHEEQNSYLKNLTQYQNSQYELTNPCNIIKILDYFEYNKQLVLVMEKTEIDLFEYLSQNSNTLSLEDKIKLCLEITIPVNFLHHNKLTHRDLKPESYFLIDNQFKLTFFDYVKQSNCQMTSNVGNQIFQAPETIQSISAQTNKVDIWALAYIYYEIFNEKGFFEYDNIKTVQNKIYYLLNDQNETFKKIDLLDCPFDLKQLMKQMFQTQQKNRIECVQIMDILISIFNKLKQPSNQQQNLNQFQRPQKFQNQNQVQFPQQQQFIQTNLDHNICQQKIGQLELQMNYLQDQIKQLESQIQSKEVKKNEKLNNKFNQQFK